MTIIFKVILLNINKNIMSTLVAKKTFSIKTTIATRLDKYNINLYENKNSNNIKFEKHSEKLEKELLLAINE